jgi:hypothetical protein
VLGRQDGVARARPLEQLHPLSRVEELQPEQRRFGCQFTYLT